MAVRVPLYNLSGDLKQMSSAQINAIIDQIIYQYSLNPSVLLSVVGSAGSLGNISDTRLQAGAVSTSTTGFVPEATTDEPTTVTVNFSRINEARTTGIVPTSDDFKTWPVYLTSQNHVQAMNIQDVLDTFIYPAITLLTDDLVTYQQAGTFFVSTLTSEAGATLVSATPIFTDTRADTSLYSAAEIPEVLDQPITINSYYLHRVTGVNNAYDVPLFITSDNNLREYSGATFVSLLQDWIRYTAVQNTAGYSLSYNINGSGNSRGTGMANTILNGVGNFATLQVGADDYRSQEFPDGAVTTASTYFLKVLQA